MKLNNIGMCLFLLSYLLLVGMVDPTRPPTYASGGDETIHHPNRLEGVFFNEARRFAIIDTMLVRVGDTLSDGAKIIAINLDSVEIEHVNKQKEILRLPGSIRQVEVSHAK